MITQRLLSLLIQLSGALCLSCILLAVVLQQDPWVKQQLTMTLLKNIQELVQVPVSGNLVTIDVLTGIVIVDNILLSKQDQWSFYCERTMVTFSWLDFLKYGSLLTDITFYKPQLYSRITKDCTLCIAKPLLHIIESPVTVPCVALRKCYFIDAALHAVTADNAEHLFGTVSSQVSLNKTTLQILCDYSKGTMLKTHKKTHERVLYNGTGTTAITLDTRIRSVTTFTTHNQFTTCITGKQQQYILFGKYKNNKGYGELKALDRSILCKLTQVTCTHTPDTTYQCTLHGILHVQVHSGELINQIYPLALSYMPDIQARLAFSYTPSTGECIYSGTLRSTHRTIAQVQIPACISTVQGNTTSAQASFELYTTGNKKIMQGNAKVQFWPFICETDIHVTNTIGLSQNISLEQATGRCMLEYTPNKGIRYKSTSLFSVAHKTAKSEKKYTITSSCVGNGYKGLGKVSFGASSAECNILYSLRPLKIEKVTIAPYIELTYNSDTNALETTLESTSIKQLSAYCGYELQGEGTVKLLLRKSNQMVMLTALLEQATMRLKGQYNMAKSGIINLEADTTLKKIVCKDSFLELHKGCVKLTQATIMLEQGACVSAHIPVTFDNCLVSWQKDFFGTFSGALVGTYTQEQEKSIKGFLTLDQSHLRSNVLSMEVQQRLLSGTRHSTSSLLENMQLILVIRNSEPIHIKTSVLESKARMNLQVQGTLASPEFSGIIELLQGKLLFAYKPLYITHAHLYLTPKQLDNTLVELTARNKIKKYTVTLHASGPVQQPVISLYASPTLQEEQIITLLLAGSEEGSLYAVMPAMIMHTLENFLFGIQHEPSQIQRSLKLLLQPLKHVRIKPDSSRPPGSFKGGVEVDLTDKLRASVQGTLHAPQNTQIEVEYAFSDDVSIKGVKDERGMFSGEIEMRWKF